MTPMMAVSSGAMSPRRASRRRHIMTLVGGNHPALRLAKAFNIEIESDRSAYTAETHYRLYWPFHNIRITENMERDSIQVDVTVSEDKATVTLYDAKHEFPSQRLINQLNLLRD